MWWRRRPPVKQPRGQTEPSSDQPVAEAAPDPAQTADLERAPGLAVPVPLPPVEDIPPWPSPGSGGASDQWTPLRELLPPETGAAEIQPELDFSRPPPAVTEHQADRENDPEAAGTVDDAPEFASPEPAWEALSAARRQALDVYARYRLPVAPALHRRSGDRNAWRPADENLTAEQRWEFVLSGSESGWRLVGLERVGRIGRTRVIEVQMAASILALTESLTRRLDEADPGVRADLAKAFELGRLTAAAEARAELVRRRRRRRARLKARMKSRERPVEPEQTDRMARD